MYTLLVRSLPGMIAELGRYLGSVESHNTFKSHRHLPPNISGQRRRDQVTHLVSRKTLFYMHYAVASGATKKWLRSYHIGNRTMKNVGLPSKHVRVDPAHYQQDCEDSI